MDEFTDMQSLSVIIKHIDEFGFVVTRRVHDCAKAGQNWPFKDKDSIGWNLGQNDKKEKETVRQLDRGLSESW